MDELIIWKDQKIKEIKDDIDGLFEIFLREFSMPYESLIKEPVVTLNNTNNELVAMVRFICPSGLKLHLTIFEDKIFLSGKGHCKTKADFSFSTNDYFFKKIIPLPCRVKAHASTATYKNGKVKIVLPKKHVDQGGKIIINID